MLSACYREAAVSGLVGRGIGSRQGKAEANIYILYLLYSIYKIT